MSKDISEENNICTRTLRHYIHRIHAIMFYMAHDYSNKLYIENEA